MLHRTMDELDGGIDEIRRAPSDAGTLALIVSRPGLLQRAVLEEGVLDEALGLVGDSWLERGSSKTADGASDPLKQLNVVSTRAMAALCPDQARHPLAGDQLHVDLDVSVANLPVGTQLLVGDAVIEVTEPPHRGCAKFTDRFGPDAVRWVNSAVGVELRLRGFNARVIRGGTIRRGDVITKVAPDA